MVVLYRIVNYCLLCGIGYMKSRGMFWQRRSPSFSMFDDVIHVKSVDRSCRLLNVLLIKLNLTLNMADYKPVQQWPSVNQE